MSFTSRLGPEPAEHDPQRNQRCYPMTMHADFSNGYSLVPCPRLCVGMIPRLEYATQAVGMAPVITDAITNPCRGFEGHLTHNAAVLDDSPPRATLARCSSA